MTTSCTRGVAFGAARCPLCWHHIGRHGGRPGGGFVLNTLYWRVVPETRQITLCCPGCRKEYPLGKLIVEERVAQ